MITAPFNFIPLNEKVFFPPWANRVGHDIPFSDGESGEIEITITAKSPIFIRNHYAEGDDFYELNGKKITTEFCNYNGQHYIPGSSVKGMVRNLLEIMSFSKISFVDDKTYAVRDLSSAKNFYMKQMNLIDEPTTRAGWLKKVGDEYIIEDCGTPGRIHHKQIDYAFNVEFSKYFEPKNFDATNQKQKSAEYKYEKLGRLLPKISVGDKYFSEKNPKYDKREFYKFKPNGKKATLVLTGQPTPRKNSGKMGDGKGFEFLFFDVKDELKVDKEVVENFKFAYFDERNTEPNESPDWKFWKKKLYNGEKIPIFFQKQGKKVLHFGLSYLYKLPYKHNIKDGIYKEHFKKDLDLAQTIFGYIDDKNALKGRVQFSHFKALKNIKVLEKRTEILGTPRASYYPIYIRQNNIDFKTYMDSDFKIAGWKRYPIHKNGVKHTIDTGNDNVGTTFAPLDKEVIFKGKIRFHNLKKAEIGAILSALTFHNHKECYHNIGLAKSLGYGKISIELKGIENIIDYLKAFEAEITTQIPSWIESIQLKELLSMAMEQDNQGNSKLEYMKLKEFADNKSKTKDYLKNYTQLNNIKTINIKSLISKEDLEKIKEKQLELEKIRKEKEEAKKQKEKEIKAWQNAKLSNTIQSIKNFIKDYPNSEYINEANEILESLKAQEAKQKEDKFKELNEKAKRAYDEVLKKKGTKGFQKAKDTFIKKWSKEKENKGSEFILELVDKVKKDK